jgi:hypothetical protein
MKKIIFLLIAVLLTTPAFSQDEGKEYFRHALTSDLIHTFLGFTQGGSSASLGYEYALVRPASVKTSFCFLSLKPEPKPSGNIFMINVEGRWYPMQNYVRGFFINGGYQFQRFTASLFNTNTDEEDGEETVKLSGAVYNHGIHAGLGYKVIFGKNLNGLVLEPFISYIFPVSSDIPSGKMAGPDRWLLGTSGFRGGLTLGYAF